MSEVTGNDQSAEHRSLSTTLQFNFGNAAEEIKTLAGALEALGRATGVAEEGLNVKPLLEDVKKLANMLKNNSGEGAGIKWDSFKKNIEKQVNDALTRNLIDFGDLEGQKFSVKIPQKQITALKNHLVSLLEAALSDPNKIFPKNADFKFEFSLKSLEGFQKAFQDSLAKLLERGVKVNTEVMEKAMNHEGKLVPRKVKMEFSAAQFEKIAQKFSEKLVSVLNDPSKFEIVGLNEGTIKLKATQISNVIKNIEEQLKLVQKHLDSEIEKVNTLGDLKIDFSKFRTGVAETYQHIKYVADALNKLDTVHADAGAKMTELDKMILGLRDTVASKVGKLIKDITNNLSIKKGSDAYNNYAHYLKTAADMVNRYITDEIDYALTELRKGLGYEPVMIDGKLIWAKNMTELNQRIEQGVAEAIKLVAAEVQREGILTPEDANEIMAGVFKMSSELQNKLKKDSEEFMQHIMKDIEIMNTQMFFAVKASIQQAISSISTLNKKLGGHEVSIDVDKLKEEIKSLEIKANISPEELNEAVNALKAKMLSMVTNTVNEITAMNGKKVTKAELNKIDSLLHEESKKLVNAVVEKTKNVLSAFTEGLASNNFASFSEGEMKVVKDGIRKAMTDTVTVMSRTMEGAFQALALSHDSITKLRQGVEDIISKSIEHANVGEDTTIEIDLTKEITNVLGRTEEVIKEIIQKWIPKTTDETITIDVNKEVLEPLRHLITEVISNTQKGIEALTNAAQNSTAVKKADLEPIRTSVGEYLKRYVNHIGTLIDSMEVAQARGGFNPTSTLNELTGGANKFLTKYVEKLVEEGNALAEGMSAGFRTQTSALPLQVRRALMAQGGFNTVKELQKAMPVLEGSEALDAIMRIITEQTAESLNERFIKALNDHTKSIRDIVNNGQIEINPVHRDSFLQTLTTQMNRVMEEIFRRLTQEVEGQFREVLRGINEIVTTPQSISARVPQGRQVRMNRPVVEEERPYGGQYDDLYGFQMGATGLMSYNRPRADHERYSDADRYLRESAIRVARVKNQFRMSNLSDENKGKLYDYLDNTYTAKAKAIAERMSRGESVRPLMIDLAQELAAVVQGFTTFKQDDTVAHKGREYEKTLAEQADKFKIRANKMRTQYVDKLNADQFEFLDSELAKIEEKIGHLATQPIIDIESLATAQRIVKQLTRDMDRLGDSANRVVKASNADFNRDRLLGKVSNLIAKGTKVDPRRLNDVQDLIERAVTNRDFAAARDEIGAIMQEHRRLENEQRKLEADMARKEKADLRDAYSFNDRRDKLLESLDLFTRNQTIRANKMLTSYKDKLNPSQMSQINQYMIEHLNKVQNLRQMPTSTHDDLDVILQRMKEINLELTQFTAKWDKMGRDNTVSARMQEVLDKLDRMRRLGVVDAAKIDALEQEVYAADNNPARLEVMRKLRRLTEEQGDIMKTNKLNSSLGFESSRNAVRADEFDLAAKKVEDRLKGKLQYDDLIDLKTKLDELKERSRALANSPLTNEEDVKRLRNEYAKLNVELKTLAHEYDQLSKQSMNMKKLGQHDDLKSYVSAEELKPIIQAMTGLEVGEVKVRNAANQWSAEIIDLDGKIKVLTGSIQRLNGELYITDERMKAEKSIGYQFSPFTVQDSYRKFSQATKGGKSIADAMVNMVRYMLAGSIVGAPMMLFGSAFDDFKAFESAMNQATQNFVFDPNELRVIAARRIEERRQLNPGEPGYVSQSEYANNYRDVFNQEYTDLLNKAQGGGLDKIIQDRAVSLGLKPSEGAEAFAIASRRLHDPNQALGLASDVMKIKAFDKSVNVEDVGKGLEAFASQWGVNLEQLNDATNMIIKVSKMTQASMMDILETQGKAGAVFRDTLPNVYRADPKKAMAEAITLSAVFNQATAKSGNEGGTFYKGFLENVYKPQSAIKMREIANEPILKEAGIDLNPYERTADGGSKQRDVLDILGAVFDANALLSKQGKTNVLNPLVKVWHQGSESAIEAFFNDNREILERNKAAIEVLNREGLNNGGAEVVKGTGKNGEITAADTLKFMAGQVSQVTDQDIAVLNGVNMGTYQFKQGQLAAMWNAATSGIFKSLEGDFMKIANYLDVFLKVVRNHADDIASLVHATSTFALGFGARYLIMKGVGKYQDNQRDNLAERADRIRTDMNLQASTIDLRRKVIEKQLDDAHAKGSDVFNATVEQLAPEMAKLDAEAIQLNNRIQLLNNRLREAGVDESKLKVQTQMVQVGFRNATIEAGLFDKALRDLATEAGIDEKVFEGLRTRIEQLNLMMKSGAITAKEYHKSMALISKEWDAAGSNIRGAGTIEDIEKASKVGGSNGWWQGVKNFMGSNVGMMITSALLGFGLNAASNAISRQGLTQNQRDENDINDAMKYANMKKTAEEQTAQGYSWWEFAKGLFGASSKVKDPFAFLFNRGAKAMATIEDQIGNGGAAQAMYERAKSRALAKNPNANEDNIRAELHMMLNETRAKEALDLYNEDASQTWLLDPKGKIIPNTVRTANITTAEEANQLLSQLTEPFTSHGTVLENNMNTTRANLLAKGFREDSPTMINAMNKAIGDQIRNLQKARDAIAQTLADLKQQGEMTPQYQAALAMDTGFANQISQLQLQQAQNSWSATDNTAYRLERDLQINQMKGQQNLDNLTMQGALADSMPMKMAQAGILQNANNIIDQYLPELQSQLEAERAKNGEGSDQYKKIWMQILQLQTEQKDNLVKIREALTSSLSDFNLPDGVKAMTYYESLTKDATHKNYSIAKGDTVINITIQGNADEETVHKISQAVDNAVNKPYQAAAQGLADNNKRIGAY